MMIRSASLGATWHVPFLRVAVFASILLAQAGCQVFPTGRSATGSSQLINGQSTLFDSQSGAPIRPLNEASSNDTAKLCLATADSLAKGGKLPEAIQLYEKARTIDPRQAEVATRKLALMYDSTGDWDRARMEYDAALKAAPKDADLLQDLGYGYYCRMQWDTAEKYLREALTINPKHAKAMVNLAMTLGQKRDYAQSYETFLKVVPPAHAHCNMAFIFTTQGRREEAKEAYRKALSLEPSLQLAQAALSKLERGDVITPEQPRLPVKTASATKQSTIPAKVAKKAPEPTPAPAAEPEPETTPEAVEKLSEELNRPVVIRGPLSQPAVVPLGTVTAEPTPVTAPVQEPAAPMSEPVSQPGVAPSEPGSSEAPSGLPLPTPTAPASQNDN